MQVYNSNKKQILHITPHLGGGVGSVLLNYFKKVKNDSNYVHKVACLDYANDNAKKITLEINMNLLDEMSKNKKDLLNIISKTDIILIHWWNHPLLFDFLVREELPPSRIIMWSHNSGAHPPGVYSNKLLNYPDMFVFTTPMSFNVDEIKQLTEDKKKSLRTIWSTGGVDHVKSIKSKTHTGFNIGYIGTVDYCKLHPNFLSMCKQVNIPDVKFIVCGGQKEKEIEKEAKELEINEKFSFEGLVPNIKKYLEEFDIFGYPLAPYHYGTCDQTLQESMAAGVVPVVFANEMEKFIIKDGVTGIIVNNEEEYIKALEKLYHNPELRHKLSKNTKEYAIKEFSLENMKHKWNELFEEIMFLPKTLKKWKIKKSAGAITIKDVFLESIGTHGKPFQDYCNAKNNKEKEKSIQEIKELAKLANWQTESKGTIYHYNSFFPKSKYILDWNKIMRKTQLLKEENYATE